MKTILRLFYSLLVLVLAASNLQAQAPDIQRAGDTFYKFENDGAIYRSDDFKITWKQILAPVTKFKTTMEIVSKPSQLNVVPNPSTGTVSIKGIVLESFPTRVDIIHLDGRMEEIPVSRMAWTVGSIMIDLSTYSGGVYTVVLTIGGQSYSTKVLRK